MPKARKQTTLYTGERMFLEITNTQNNGKIYRKSRKNISNTTEDTCREVLFSKIIGMQYFSSGKCSNIYSVPFQITKLLPLFNRRGNVAAMKVFQIDKQTQDTKF